MKDLSILQKVLRPVLNFLVERFFPNGAFYGNEFFNAFREVDDSSKLGQASVSWIVHNMNKMNADYVKFELEGMSISGVMVGDFEIVGRLSSKASLHSKESSTDG